MKQASEMVICKGCAGRGCAVCGGRGEMTIGDQDAWFQDLANGLANFVRSRMAEIETKRQREARKAA